MIMMEEDTNNHIILVQGESSWTHPKGNKITEAIAEDICTFLEIDNINVSPALARNSPTNPNNPPWAYNSRGLSAEQALLLKEHQVLASQLIQMHIFPTVFMGSSGYRGTIHGLVPTNLKNFTNTKRDILTKDITDILFKHKGFHKAVMAYTQDTQSTDTNTIPEWQYNQCV